MRKNPLLTVLMPVYNAERYLPVSIESILQQTYGNFEFLIFDDGSEDKSLEIIKRYSDKRIRLYHSKKNLGYVHHLNNGLEIARGDYIARMDADDISIKGRFAKQVNFLQENPEVGILGTAIRTLHADGSASTWLPERTHEQIKSYLLFDTCFAHPSVMMRRQVIVEHKLQYNESYMPAEDYKLWTEILNISKGANVKDVLLHYRESDTQISSQKSKDQISLADQIRKEFFGLAKINSTPEQLAYHSSLLNNEWEPEQNYFINAIAWYHFLLSSNDATRFFNKQALGNILAKFLFHKCERHASIKFDTYKLFKQSGLNCYYRPSISALLKCKAKTMVKK